MSTTRGYINIKDIQILDVLIATIDQKSIAHDQYCKVVVDTDGNLSVVTMNDINRAVNCVIDISDIQHHSVNKLANELGILTGFYKV